MLVSLFTDASFCSQTKAAGWGYWVKSERKRTYGGGPFKIEIATPAEAETLAFINGVVAGLKDGVIEEGDHVLWQTDCEHAIRVYENKQVRTTRNEQHAKLLARQFTTKNAITYQCRWVKGHVSKNKSQARHFVNNVSDKFARAAMLAERKKRGYRRSILPQRKKKDARN